MALLGPGVAAPGPRLVVSMPALHSLVAALMEGAGEPELLYPMGAEPSDSLGPVQKAQLVVADMVIWVGPGLESDLARTFAAMPGLAGKAMALSDDIPLLKRDGYRGPLEDRQASRALEFWTDPRLATHVVRHITPHLVRMDPDHQDLYLDNEMTLVARLRDLEADIVSALGPVPGLPIATLAGVDPYFRHRFLGPETDITAAETQLLKVTVLGPATCTGIAADTVPAGPTYYFNTMRSKARALAACLPGRNEGEAAAGSDSPPAGAS